MNVSLSSILVPVTAFFSRYHATMFFTFISLLLSAAILNLYLTTQTTNPNSSVVGDTISADFDQKTANKIKELRDSNESPQELVIPKPRGNPFVE